MTFRKPLKGWAKRAQILLIRARHATLGTNEAQEALRELVAIAWRQDLTSEDRLHILKLIDNYRKVDDRQDSKDAMEGLALLVSNPTEAARDRAHQWQLEVLSRMSNEPKIYWSPQASYPPQPGNP